MKRFFLPVLILILLSGCSFPQGQDSLYKLLYKFEIPKYFKKDKDNIIQHIGYTLLYDEEHEQAKWVAYELTKEEAEGKIPRKDKFINDPFVLTGCSGDDDYAGSGYDRGHLAPAADMCFSDTTMKESFYYSNMSPQKHSFNAGIWKQLETQVRRWASDYGYIYVVTGPVLNDTLPRIGSNKVSIPQQYYKAILHYNGSDRKAIGFLMSQTSPKKKLQSFAVPVDSLEKLTGLNFFPLLPDSQERSLERKADVSKWKFKN